MCSSCSCEDKTQGPCAVCGADPCTCPGGGADEGGAPEKGGGEE